MRPYELDGSSLWRAAGIVALWAACDSALQWWDARVSSLQAASLPKPAGKPGEPGSSASKQAGRPAGLEGRHFQSG